MWVGLLTDRINNKLEKRNLINEHALNNEPVPLTEVIIFAFALLLWFLPISCLLVQLLSTSYGYYTGIYKLSS